MQLPTTLDDLRFGWRLAIKNPGFTAIAVLTLALGVGANTAIFSVINTVLLDPPPLPAPGNVMVVFQVMSNGQPNAFTVPAFVDWRKQGGLGADFAATIGANFNLTTAAEPERVAGARVSANFFSVAGVRPLMGRAVEPADDQPGAAPVAVISYELWQEHFSGDPSILGRTLQANGTLYSIIGVMPRGFRVLNPLQRIWVPAALPTSSAGMAHTVHQIFALMRLPPGMSLHTAETQLAAVAGRAHKQDATGDVGFGVQLQGLNDYLSQGLKPVLLVLLACAGLVLLIACANVANLLLARGASRQREIAIRMALGASGGRLVRQLLTESMILAIAGGGLGLFFASIGVRALQALSPPGIPHAAAIAIDGHALAFAMIVALAGGILFGFAPAMQARRVDALAGVREGGRSFSAPLTGMRALLAGAQVALSLMLLAGAGLLMRSLWLFNATPPGFNPTGVLTARVTAPGSLPAAQLPAFYSHLNDRLSVLPGVTSAVIVRDLPMGGVDPSMPIDAEGQPPRPPGSDPILTRLRAIGPGYFHALEIPIQMGREFTGADSAAAPAVAVISRSLADKYWPGANPIGKRLQPRIPDSAWYTVIGVAADIRHWGADVPVEDTVYYPYTQIAPAFLGLLEQTMSVAVRSGLPVSTLAPAIRAAVRAEDPLAVVFAVSSLEQSYQDSGSLRRFNLFLLGVFAALAVVLAAIGVYGVVAYAVVQRTREFGVRMAIGASRADVLRLVLRQGGLVAGAGIVGGLIAAATAGRVLADQLFGVKPFDPASLTAAAIVVVLAAVPACLLPAWRATRTDPPNALRSE